MKKPQPSANDWLSVIVAASRGEPEKVPEGFQSIEEISEETGRSVTQVRKHLKEAAKLGLVEQQKFKVQTGGKLYPVPHFRIQ